MLGRVFIRDMGVTVLDAVGNKRTRAVSSWGCSGPPRLVICGTLHCERGESGAEKFFFPKTTSSGVCCKEVQPCTRNTVKITLGILSV